MSMRVSLGLDAAAAQKGIRQEIVWDSDLLVNGHTLLAGMSGSGKSYTLKRMIAGMRQCNSDVRFHIFDVHGDLSIPGASEVVFAEAEPYGLNPLVVNPDRHFGGVRRCIQAFISTINDTASTPLGVKQVSCLRNLLEDMYRMGGFTDDPDTWFIDENQARLVSDGSDNRLYLDVPFAEKDDAKALGAMFDRDKRLWYVWVDQYEGSLTKWPPKSVGRTHPALSDLIRYAERVHWRSFMGADQEAVMKAEIFLKLAAARQRRDIEAFKGRQTFECGEQDDKLEKAKAKAVEAYIRYCDAVRTGHEFEDLMKYDSADTLKSVLDRLKELRATGLFKGVAAPFDPHTQIWTYKLNALSQAEKKMFVRFRLQELFRAALQRGETPGVKDVLVLDEVHLYADADPDNILNTLSKESRKFGVAILAAAQNANLPEDFISSLATKIVLGIDEMFWRGAETKMNIERRLLAWVMPQRTMAVQMKQRAATRSAWSWVVLPGVRVAQQEVPKQSRAAAA
jgi:hypothetical protein